jgi:O-acetyl-ADP-ribose deacetylase (regulator of RNase III)
MNKILHELTLASTAVQLVKGDITLSNTDVVVNPANNHLMHGGGLAGLLSKKAGPALQQESRTWVKEHGPVTHDSPAYTGAGELPFRYIIHAVGPVWGSGDERGKLNDTVLGALKTANDLGVGSIALPAISTGIFGFPLEPAAVTILSSIKEYVESNPGTGLEKIQVVLYDDRSASIFSEVWTQTMP